MKTTMETLVVVLLLMGTAVAAFLIDVGVDADVSISGQNVLATYTVENNGNVTANTTGTYAIEQWMIINGTNGTWISVQSNPYEEILLPGESKVVGVINTTLPYGTYRARITQATSDDNPANDEDIESFVLRKPYKPVHKIICFKDCESEAVLR